MSKTSTSNHFFLALVLADSWASDVELWTSAWQMRRDKFAKVGRASIPKMDWNVLASASLACTGTKEIKYAEVRNWF